MLGAAETGVIPARGRDRSDAGREGVVRVDTAEMDSWDTGRRTRRNSRKVMASASEGSSDTDLGAEMERVSTPGGSDITTSEPDSTGRPDSSGGFSINGYGGTDFSERLRAFQK